VSWLLFVIVAAQTDLRDSEERQFSMSDEAVAETSFIKDPLTERECLGAIFVSSA